MFDKWNYSTKLLKVVLKEMSGLLEETTLWKAELKFAKTMHGVQCVMMDGMASVLKLCAGSLDFQLQVFS